MLEFEKIIEKAESFLHPVIVEGRGEQDTNWAVIAGRWYPIPKTVTIEMLWKAWENGNPRQTQPTADRWKVKGSKGDNYTVQYKGGLWTCDCHSYGWRRRCKHIDSIKSTLK